MMQLRCNRKEGYALLQGIP